MEVVRKYPKFLGTAGEIGGMIEIFFILVGFVYAFYNEREQRRYQIKNILQSRSGVVEQMYHPNELDTIKKMEEAELDKREDIINFYESEMSFEVFSEMLLKPYHRELLPLVYLHMSKKEMDQQNSESNQINSNIEIGKLKRNQIMQEKAKQTKTQSTHDEAILSNKALSTSQTVVTVQDRKEQEEIYSAVKEVLNYKKNRFNGNSTKVQTIMDLFITNHLPEKFLKLCKSGRTVSYVFVHGRSMNRVPSIDIHTPNNKGTQGMFTFDNFGQSVSKFKPQGKLFKKTRTITGLNIQNEKQKQGLRKVKVARKFNKISEESVQLSENSILDNKATRKKNDKKKIILSIPLSGSTRKMKFGSSKRMILPKKR